MRWIPWGWKSKELGDIFEQEVEGATQIEAKLVHSGRTQDRTRAALLAYVLDKDMEDRHYFIIKRTLGGVDRTDHHLFIVNVSAMGETEVEWWHHQQGFKKGPLYLGKLENQKGAHEITRILGKHWDFSKHL